MNILYLASEHAGLVKVGGLADVAASLPAALARRGHQVRVLLPLYGCLRDRAGGAMRQIVHVPGGALYAWRAGRRDLQV